LADCVGRYSSTHLCCAQLLQYLTVSASPLLATRLPSQTKHGEPTGGSANWYEIVASVKRRDMTSSSEIFLPLGTEPSGMMQWVPQTLEDEQHDECDMAAKDGEEDRLHADQDDAQSFIQPPISIIAIHLSAPRTPATEAAAIEVGSNRCCDEETHQTHHLTTISSSAGTEGVWTSTGQPMSDGSLGTRTRATRPSSPAQNNNRTRAEEAGDVDGKGPVVAAAKTPLSNQSKQGHKRSSSVGMDALKRFSKALPTISLPTGLLAGLPTSGFFSPNSSQNAAVSQSQTQITTPSAPGTTSCIQGGGSLAVKVSLARGTQVDEPLPPGRRGSHKTPSMASRRSIALRRSISDESLLYHSFSRSPLAGEGRFEMRRNAGNTRFRAILDSFPEVPSFKMPQISSQCFPGLRYPLHALFCQVSAQPNP